MVQHKQKSRTFRRVKVKTINGTKVSYERRKPRAPTCPVTGQTLKGIARELPIKMKNMPKSQKTVSRAFGGNLSSSASRAEIKKRARTLQL